MLQVIGAALGAVATRWRASLVVLMLIFVPMALPFVLFELVNGLVMRGDAGADIILRYITGPVSSPSTITLILGMWLLLLGPWAMGIWGATGTGAVRFRIGWEPYVRYLVIVLGAAVVMVVDDIAILLFGLTGWGPVFPALAFDFAALYVVFRAAPAAPAVQSGGLLDLRGTWRGSRPDRWRILGLAALWTGLGVVFMAAAQIAAFGVTLALESVDVGTSLWPLLLVSGAPGLITGTAAALVTLVSLAIFWTLAERYGDQP
ncbi:hypothetical protein [Gymnodinialimonas sp.]